MNSPPGTSIFVVGNKTDLDEKRTVSYEEGKRFSQNIEADSFLETSAKTGEAVDGLFTLFASAEGVLIQEPEKAKAKTSKDGKCCN